MEYMRQEKTLLRPMKLQTLAQLTLKKARYREKL